MSASRISRVGVIDDIKVIGDVHLGKRFVTGVPLHRRGEREQMVMEQFKRELTTGLDGIDLVVQTGDIFDKFVVPNEVLDWTASTIIEAASANPSVTFVFYRGNHDAQRDLQKVSSFDLLADLCWATENIRFVIDRPFVFQGSVAFLPWHPVTSAAEMAKQLPTGLDLHCVFGHYDLKSYGDDSHNVIPIEQLKPYTKLIITGHDHRPRAYEQDAVEVICVGSMQPYAFGEEDPSEPNPVYYDLTLVALETIKIDLHNKCVRVWLQDGETLPTEFDCLQLVAKRGVSNDEEEVDVTMGDFDMEALFRKAFTAAEVDEETTADLFQRFQQARVA